MLLYIYIVFLSDIEPVKMALFRDVLSHSIDVLYILALYEQVAEMKDFFFNCNKLTEHQ